MKSFGQNFIYLVAVSTAFSLFISCSSQATTIEQTELAVFTPVPEPEAISPEEWADEMEVQLIIYREAFEELTLEFMKIDMESYKVINNDLKNIEDEFESFLDELDEQARYSGNFAFRGAESEERTEDSKKLNKLQKNIERGIKNISSKYAELGYTRVESKKRIVEMENEKMMNSIKLEQYESKIGGKQIEVAGLLGDDSSKQRLEELGKELNQLENLYQQVSSEQEKLDKIIRLTRRDLKDVHYYWVGPSYKEKIFDRAFRERQKIIAGILDDMDIIIQ